MFTGIIQGQGEISSLRKTGAECRLAIRPLFTLPDVIDGESIAVNGACQWKATAATASRHTPQRKH